MEREREGDGRSSMINALRLAAIVSNIVLLGFACWAIVDQYPHPEEQGVVAYTVLVLLAPILSAVALLRSEREGRLAGPSY